MRRSIEFIVAALLLTASTSAFGMERFPPPDFSGGRKLPLIETPPPKADYMEFLDAGVLLGGLILGSYFVLRLRSKRALVWLGIFSLGYFGFYRQGCVCAIGSIQNVTQAVFDPNYTASWVVLAFFFLPLVFTAFFGRSFCAAVCPHGAIQDLIALKPIEIPLWLERGLRLFAYAYLGLAVLFAAVSPVYIICRYDPFIPIFRLTGDWGGFLLGAVFLGVGVFIGRPYCRFMCPYGVLLGLLGKVARKNVSITPDKCINCRLCEHACPYNAIIPSSEEQKKDTRAADKKRLVLTLAAFPVIVLLLSWVGGQAGDVFARGHYTVDTAEQVYLQEAGAIEPEADDSVSAFKGTGVKKEQLYAEAEALRERFVFGSWIFGGFMGLVIGLKLIGMAINRRRDDYHIDAEGCIACGRCYDLCSVEQVRLDTPDADPDMRQILSAAYEKEAVK